MKLTDLTLKPLQIPFKIAFSHSSSTRTMTDSVLVSASTDNNTGFGESCPRSYVTNESLQTLTTFFETNKTSIIESITDLPTLKEWLYTHTELIDMNPAAFCSIELALLDLLAKENDCIVESLLGLPELSGDFAYSAILGDSRISSFSKLLNQYKAMGFKDYKLKLSGNFEHDKAKCDLVFSQIPQARVRLDANNLWQNEHDVIQYINELGYKFFALEEPLISENYDGLSLIAHKLKLKIILDESFLRLQQFNFIKDSPANWIINIRISKMGGLFRSLAIAQAARKMNIKCIVGAQVGETSLLTRAALTLVNAYKDIVIAQEGGCGTYLLEKDICKPVLMFGQGGLITQDKQMSLDKSGFGFSHVDSE